MKEEKSWENSSGDPPCSITLSMKSATAKNQSGYKELLRATSVKWSWACRHLISETQKEHYYVVPEKPQPRPGDVALVRVEKVGHHGHIETTSERRLRIYPGDWFTCVFGSRYATDVFEGRVLGLEKLHLLTWGGLVGTVVLRHRGIGQPTAVSFLGYIADSSGRRVNLIDLHFPPLCSDVSLPDAVLVLGTSMNAGKTTVARKIARGLVTQGVPVGACKLTGSVSPRDLYELRATGVLHATDFSDYGFPSTYGTPLPELIGLFDHMTNACARKGAQLVVIEVADGILQPETKALLESEEIRRRVRGVVLAAACSESALHAADVIQRSGFEVWAVSGLITNSPLFVREFAIRNPLPVAPSCGSGSKLANIIVERMKVQRTENWRTAALANSC